MMMKVIMIVTSILNIVAVVLMNEWRWWWKECSGVAQEDKIFRAVSSLLLLDKFSCVEDDRTEGRAHLTRRLLLLQDHFIIFWTYFHISEFSQKVVLVVWKVLSSVGCFFTVCFAVPALCEVFIAPLKDDSEGFLFWKTSENNLVSMSALWKLLCKLLTAFH